MEDIDDRRYMLLTLDCCVSMRATIGFGDYKDMTTDAIQASLTAELIKRWNSRSSEDPKSNLPAIEVLKNLIRPLV